MVAADLPEDTVDGMAGGSEAGNGDEFCGENCDRLPAVALQFSLASAACVEDDGDGHCCGWSRIADLARSGRSVGVSGCDTSSAVGTGRRLI